MYKYEELKPELFKEQNQRMFLEIRDKAKNFLRQAGAFTLHKAFVTGDTWIMTACIDRLVELGELKEIPTKEAANDRIFTSP